MQDMTAYELQMVQLNNDRQRLKQIQATAAKVVLKTAFTSKLFTLYRRHS